MISSRSSMLFAGTIFTQRVPAVPGPAASSPSRSCRGSAARPRCGRRAWCSSSSCCSSATPTPTGRRAGSRRGTQAHAAHRAAAGEPASAADRRRTRAGSRAATRTRRCASSGLLVATIGLPYFLLSTTGPLVQAWLARTPWGAQVVSAVRAVELRVAARAAGLSVAARAVDERCARSRCGWSAGYGGVRGAVRAPRGTGAPAGQRRSRRRLPLAAPTRRDTAAALGDVPAVARAAGDGLVPAAGGDQPHHAERRVDAFPVGRCRSTLYLMTFILCFESDGWYRRALFLPAAAAALLLSRLWRCQDGIGSTREHGARAVCRRPFRAVHGSHGELAHMRPAPALPDALLPDGVARRRARRRRRRAGRAAAAPDLLRDSASAWC